MTLDKKRLKSRKAQVMGLMNKERKKESAMKFDGNKLRVDLLPIPALLGVSAVLTHGAIKYDDRNWEKGFSWSRPFGALLRHLLAFWCGEEIDEDSGLSHIDQVTANAMFLSHFSKMGTGTDDRPGGKEREIYKQIMDFVKKLYEEV